MIKCINELEAGEPYDESIALLKSLDRPLEDEESSIQLFARNMDVDIFNYNKLNQIPGHLSVYHAVDEGSEHYLNRFLTPKHLGVKVGCPVILIKNISDVLLNGIRSTVTNVYEKSVAVNFEVGKKVIAVRINPETFSTFDPVDKTIIAKRTQLPLKLAYALTIHKSQGMSLENVTVNCQHSIQAGQLGVAVGRAISVKGLKAVNFKKHLCKKHPGFVFNFYESFSVGEVQHDLSCCRDFKTSHQEASDTETACSDTDSYRFENVDDDSDFSDSEIEKLEFLDTIIDQDTGQQVFSKETLLSRSAFDNVILEFLDTPVEDEILKFKSNVFSDFKLFSDWFDEHSSIIEDIGLNCFPEGEAKFT